MNSRWPSILRVSVLATVVLVSVQAMWNEFEIIGPLNSKTGNFQTDFRIRRFNKTYLMEGTFVFFEDYNDNFDCESMMSYSSIGNNQYKVSPYKLAKDNCCKIFDTSFWNALHEELEKKSDLNIDRSKPTCYSYIKGNYTLRKFLFNRDALPIHLQPGTYKFELLYYRKNEVKLDSHFGYYVAAGIPIQIDVLEQTGFDVWSARIGCHSDDLRNCHELRRWSCISICKSLSKKTVQMNSAFGGLLFLQSPKGEENSIKVKLHHVVLTPTYDVTKPNRSTLWKSCSKEAGLWADVAGQFIVFNLPSKSVLHLTPDQLDRALQFWDSIVLAHHDLRGTRPIHRERIVCDEQPSVGYMHSGYPIVTHMDISDEKSKDFVFDSKKLEENGSWGLFHELGHNMQQDWWTFDGTVEVTVNIFTLHAMDKVCHLKPWIHEWLKNQLSHANKYVEKGSNFDEWKKNPGVALFIYAQLAREYGWDSYKEVFRKYEETKPTLGTDKDKMDHWIKTFSEQVGLNLVPLFRFWGFSVSASIVDDLKNRPIPNICDEFICMAPERYSI